MSDNGLSISITGTIRLQLARGVVVSCPLSVGGMTTAVDDPQKEINGCLSAVVYQATKDTLRAVEKYVPKEAS